MRVCVNKYLTVHQQLGGALAGKTNLLYGLGQNSIAGKMLTLLDFGTYKKKLNCRQMIDTSRRSIFHAPKSSQMPYTAKMQKINDVNNKIKNPLELRLVAQLILKHLGPHMYKIGGNQDPDLMKSAPDFSTSSRQSPGW